MKIVKPLLITLSVLVVLLVAAALVLPPFAKNYINKHGKELTGRQVRLQGLYLNIFTGYTRLTDFRLMEPDDQETFVAFDTLIVDVSLFRLLSNELRINQIQLTNPTVQLIQKGDHFNFDDLLATGQKDTLPDPASSIEADNSSMARQTQTITSDSLPASPREGLAIALYNIGIKGGHILYEDKIRQSLWQMENFGLQIPGVYFNGKDTDVGINLNFNDGGHLKTAIQYNMEAGNYILDIDLSNFSIAPIRPYLTDFLKVNSINGILTTHLNIEGNAQHITDINVKGFVDLHSLLMTDAENQKIISTDSLHIGLENINPGQSLFHFDTIAIHGIQTGFAMYTDGNTMSQLMVEAAPDTLSTPQTSSTEAGGKTPADLRINQFQINNSLFTFEDHTLHTPFTFTLENINFRADHLSLREKNKAKISSTLNNGGTITFNYEGKFDDIGNTDLLLSIKNLDLQAFSPYSLQYFGYPLHKGILSFHSINNIQNHMLEGRNNLNIAKCEVADKQKSPKPEYNIPLKTALYLIKDKNDQIKMELPVQGDINSPEFSYKKIIFKTLTNLLVKVAVSPVSFLANSLGFSPDKLKSIPFEAAQNDFSPEQLTQINQLAEIIKAKPEMTLTLHQYVNIEQSKLTLARFHAKRNYYLMQHPEKESDHLLPIDYSKIYEQSLHDAGFLNYVNSLISDELKTASLENQLLSLADSTQLDHLTYQLINRRNQLLTEYLLRQGVPAQCCRITTATKEELSNYKGKNQYKVDMYFEGDEPDETLLTENNAKEGE